MSRLTLTNLLRGALIAGVAVLLLAAEALITGSPASVQAGDPPGQPARPVVDSVSHDSVTISWSGSGDSSITGYQILRRSREPGASRTFSVVENDTGSATTTYTDTSVSASSAYVYRVKARNSHGLSPASGFVRANTPAAPATATPTPTPTPVNTVEPVNPPAETPQEPLVAQQQQQQQQESPTESVSEPDGEDFPDDETTDGWVVVGDEYGATGTLDDDGDGGVDGFKINLTAGKRYRVDVLANGYHDVSLGGTFAGTSTLEVLSLDGATTTDLHRLNGVDEGATTTSDVATSTVKNKGGGPDNSSRAEFDVLATDTYLIKVDSNGGGSSTSTNTYTVKAWDITSEQAFGDFTSGYINGRLKIGDANAMTGTISDSRDRDYYIALLEDDKCYAIHAKGQHSDPNHKGGTLNDPKIKLMKFYDYYEKQYYITDPVRYVGASTTSAYLKKAYIDPVNLKLLSADDKMCSRETTEDDNPVDMEICNYYCNDNGGRGNNAKLEVEVGDEGGSDYQVIVYDANRATGTYSLFAEEIDCSN